MYNFSPRAVFVMQAVVVVTKLLFPILVGMCAAYSLGIWRLRGVRAWFLPIAAIVGALVGYIFFSDASQDPMWPYSSPAGGGLAGLIAYLYIVVVHELFKGVFRAEAPLTSELVARPASRLGIMHVMAWFMGIATLLSLQHILSQGGLSRDVNWIVLAYSDAKTVIAGMAVGSLVLWIIRHVQGDMSFPIAPGHYLLLLHGSVILLYAIGFPTLQLGCRSLGIMPFPFYLIQSLLAAIAAMGALLCIGDGVLSQQWRNVFLVYFFGTSFTAIVYLAAMSLFRNHYDVDFVHAWIQHGLTVAMAFSVLLAMCLDVRHGVRHDWLHYTGTVMWFANAATYLVFRLALWLGPDHSVRFVGWPMP